MLIFVQDQKEAVLNLCFLMSVGYKEKKSKYTTIHIFLPQYLINVDTTILRPNHKQTNLVIITCYPSCRIKVFPSLPPESISRSGAGCHHILSHKTLEILNSLAQLAEQGVSLACSETQNLKIKGCFGCSSLMFEC